MQASTVKAIYEIAQDQVIEDSKNIDLFLQYEGVRTAEELPELARLEYNNMVEDRDALLHHITNVQESIGILAARLNISVS